MTYKKKDEKSLPKLLPGNVHQQFKKCGNSNCKCANGFLHGPYFYHFVRVNGKSKKRYLRAGEVEQVKAACQRRQHDEKEQRKRGRESWENFEKSEPSYASLEIISTVIGVKHDER